MIVSRGLNLSRLSSLAMKNLLLKNNGICLKQIRNCHEYYYRRLPPRETSHHKSCTAIGAFFWWWVLWHFFTDYHHLTGHSYPNPSTFTDEELGIPED